MSRYQVSFSNMITTRAKRVCIQQSINASRCRCKNLRPNYEECCQRNIITTKLITKLISTQIIALRSYNSCEARGRAITKIQQSAKTLTQFVESICTPVIMQGRKSERDNSKTVGDILPVLGLHCTVHSTLGATCCPA